MCCSLKITYFKIPTENLGKNKKKAKEGNFFNLKLALWKYR